MNKRLSTWVAIVMLAYAPITRGAQRELPPTAAEPARAQVGDTADIALYKQWKLTRDTPEGLALAVQLIREWPCSSAAGAVFYSHYWGRHNRNAHEARCAVSQAYVDSVEPALAEQGVAKASSDAHPCGEYMRWALGYLAANGDDPISARECFRRYCASYDCAEWPLPEFARLPAPSN